MLDWQKGFPLAQEPEGYFFIATEYFPLDFPAGYDILPI